MSHATIPAELDAVFAIATADLRVAVSTDPTDLPAWCQRVAACRRVLAALYTQASGHAGPDSLLWWALRDAACHSTAHAHHLDGESGTVPTPLGVPTGVLTRTDPAWGTR